MLVTVFEDSLCWWQVSEVSDQLFTQKSPEHISVTNILKL